MEAIFIQWNRNAGKIKKIFSVYQLIIILMKRNFSQHVVYFNVTDYTKVNIRKY